MKFDTPATTNPIDQLKVVGKPTDRIDGPFKTTGTAPYAYERHDAVRNQAYGYVVGSAIAKGRIASIDLTDAKAAPGVVAIVTADNAGKLGKGNFNTATLLGGPDIEHYHQAIAVVVAETFEQARAAAQLVRVDYVSVKGAFDLAAAKDTATAPPGNEFSGPPDTAVGDFAGTFAAAPVQLDATYTTPDQSHAMMEPHASIAAWDGDKLTLWTSNQMIAWTTGDMAKTLGIPKENVRLVSPFIGGGFGGKLFLRADAVLAALGARAARRPVKVALTRPLMANNTTHRPATIQRIRIGATPDGKITAIGHEGWSGDLPGGGPENAVNQTRLLYAGANRMTATRLAALDLPEGNAMRAPGEAPGLMALEIAMDEMAEKLGLDPVEFRILNDTQVDPEHPERPFSQRQLVACLRMGAERFGWDKRNATPASNRDGRWLVGMGVAAGLRNNLLTKSAARVKLDRDGVVTVETDMTDIGTGTYTIIAQTAAETMGRAARQGGRAPGRLRVPGFGWIGRTMGRQQLDLRRLCGVHQAAAGGGAEARLQLCRRRVRRWPSPIRQSQRVACRGCGRERPRRRGRDRIWRSRQAVPAVDIRRAFCRGRRGRCDGRDPREAHAGGVRGRPHPQSKVGAQPGHRRDDHGRRRGADGRARRRQAPRFLRQP